MKRKLILALLFAVVACITIFSIFGCAKPMVEMNEEIESYETAYVVPLEGKTGAQAKFESVEYLENLKVAAKRIILTQRKKKTGRWERIDFDWIPTVRVIKVSRTPESREWTQDPATGSGPKDEALHMESKDGINFYTGVTITAKVKEANTSQFLYLYRSGKLSEVLDRDVRAAAQEKLAREFGMLSQTECNDQKSTVFVTVKGELVEEFEEEGITITTFGQQGGFQFQDKTIQEALNKKFAAELDKKTAEEEKSAQETRNLMAEARAESDRKVAEEYAKEAEAQQEIKLLDIQSKIADALLESAKQGQPIVPQVSSGGGGSMIYQMLQPQKTE